MPTSPPSSATWASGRRPASRKASRASSPGTGPITGCENPPLPLQGRGDHVKHGGGALPAQEAPPPRFARSPSPGNPGEDLQRPALHAGQRAASVEVLEVGKEAGFGDEAGERLVAQIPIGFVR